MTVQAKCCSDFFTRGYRSTKERRISMKHRNMFALLMCIAVVFSFVFVGNAWAEKPDIVHTKGVRVSYSNFFSSPGYVSVSETSVGEEKAWSLSMTYNDGTATIFGFGVIPADLLELTLPPNRKNADLYIDTSAFSGLASPYYFNGPFDVIIDLHFSVTNTIWQKTESHSLLDYGDFTVFQQGKSEYNGAYVDGQFGNFIVEPVEIGAPMGQVGTTDSFQLMRFK